MFKRIIPLISICIILLTVMAACNQKTKDSENTPIENSTVEDTIIKNNIVDDSKLIQEQPIKNKLSYQKIEIDTKEEILGFVNNTILYREYGDNNTISFFILDIDSNTRYELGTIENPGPYTGSTASVSFRLFASQNPEAIV